MVALRWRRTHEKTKPRLLPPSFPAARSYACLLEGQPRLQACAHLRSSPVWGGGTFLDKVGPFSKHVQNSRPCPGLRALRCSQRTELRLAEIPARNVVILRAFTSSTMFKRPHSDTVRMIPPPNHKSLNHSSSSLSKGNSGVLCIYALRRTISRQRVRSKADLE